MSYLKNVRSLDLVNVAHHLIQKLTNVFCERVNKEVNESTHNVLCCSFLWQGLLLEALVLNLRLSLLGYIAKRSTTLHT